MKALRRTGVFAWLLAAAVLSGCATPRVDYGGVPKASSLAECKGTSDKDCVIEVAIAEIGDLDCKVKVAAGFDRVALGPSDKNAARVVIWQLVPPAGKEKEYAFVDDVGVYVLSAQDPKDTEFSKNQASGHKQKFRWVSKRKGGIGQNPTEVKYNFLVTRTGSAYGQQIRVCDNTDPVIYNSD